MRHDERKPSADESGCGKSGPESRTTASSAPSCATCGRPLTGRKTRFCSDRCRMRDHRAASAARVAALLAIIDRSTTALRVELLGDEGTSNGS
jgi:predicted nucleic acid-binding Zn ribbon protein